MTAPLPKKHGGPEDVQTAWKILAGGAPVAAAALVDVAENGKSEVARVQAASAVLDRVGLATPKEVHFRVVPAEAEEFGIDQKLSPAQVIRARLKELQGPTQALVDPLAAAAGPAEAEAWAASQSDDGVIYDAEVLDGDGDWQQSNPWS
jgi:hypothetical protein